MLLRSTVARLVAGLAFATPVLAQPTEGNSFKIHGVGAIAASAVAYSLYSAEYLVVWHRQVGTSTQILGQRVSWTGVLEGGTIAIDIGLPSKGLPDVAYVAKTKRWLVAWPETLGGRTILRGRTAAPSTGAMSATATLVSSAKNHVEVTLSSDRSTVDNDAVIVWREAGVGLLASRVQVPASGAPFRWSAHVLSNDPNDRMPRISRSGGNTRRYVVTWRRERGARDDIYARAIDAKGKPLGAALAVSAGRHDESSPEVDGDGTNFVAVWARRETFASQKLDVYARKLRFDGRMLVADSSIRAMATKRGDDERDPVITYLGGKYALVFSPDSGSINKHAIQIQMLGDDLCRCGGSLNMNRENNEDWKPRIGSAYAGGSSSDRGLMTFVSTPRFGGLFGRRVKASGNGLPLTNLGGGCGSGGQLSKLSPFVLGSQFKLRLSGASLASNVAICNIAGDGPPLLSCGPCDITNPTLLLPMPLTAGSGTIGVRIPCCNDILGGAAQFQAYVLSSGSTPCVGIDGISFSNIARGLIAH